MPELERGPLSIHRDIELHAMHRRAAKQLVGLAGVVLAACGSPLPLDPDAGVPTDTFLDDGSGFDAGNQPGPDASDAGVPDARIIDHPELVALCGAVPVKPEDWERCFAKRKCEWKLHCEPKNLFASVDECIALNSDVQGGKLEAEIRQRRRAIDMQRASIDDGTFAQCLFEMGPDRCTTALLAPSCATRFTGTIDDGDPCFTDIECKSPGATCQRPQCADACCLGTCTPRGQEGDECFTFFACEPGLMCGTDNKCTRGDVGSRCRDGSDCDPANWCDTKVGRCVPDVAPGEPCTTILACGGETSCVGLKRTAEPPSCRRVTHKGDACDQDCFGNLFCDLPGSLTEFGTCRPLPSKLTQGCSDLVPCTGVNNLCLGGQCVARPGEDQSCRNGICRPGLFCTRELNDSDPRCKPRLADRQEFCNRPSQCLSFVCSGNENHPGACQPWLNTCSTE